MMEKTVVVKNEAGLDPGRIAVMVQTACKFESSVHLKNEERKVNAKSLLGVLSLGIVKGTDISIGAEGPDEEAAVMALQQLVETDFKEFAG